ncbi:MAG: TRAP transporter small permease subunit [Minwuia sp.]|nr:TRAP transporter small permease subunit [Minwuia sp.]
MDRLKSIDRISGWMSVVSSWTLLAMTLIVGVVVIARFALTRPTIWAWVVIVQLMLLLLMFGVAECYRRDAHVRVDILTGVLSPRGRAILDVLYAPVFFLITIIVVWTGWEYFQQAFDRNQTAPTIFAPPLWPIKFAIPLGGAVLLLTGITKLIRDLKIAFGGAENRSEAGQ